MLDVEAKSKPDAATSFSLNNDSLHEVFTESRHWKSKKKTCYIEKSFKIVNVQLFSQNYIFFVNNRGF